MPQKHRIPRSPENLPRHELIGLPVQASSTTQQVSMDGVVVDETRDTLRVETDKGEKTLPKDTYRFTFTLPDQTRVTVSGDLLTARPADRLKQKLPDNYMGGTQ